MSGFTAQKEQSNTNQTQKAVFNPASTPIKHKGYIHSWDSLVSVKETE